MATVLFLSDAPYSANIEEALTSTFGQDIDIVKVNLLHLLGKNPKDKLKALIEKNEDTIALAADVPLPLLQRLMGLRFELRVPLFCPIYRLDECGWPRKRELEGGEAVLEASGFEELVQLQAHHEQWLNAANQ